MFNIGVKNCNIHYNSVFCTFVESHKIILEFKFPAIDLVSTKAQ